MAGLTPKQERFCLEYHERGNASDAYRAAYFCEKMKPETINREAAALLANHKVATRLTGLRREAAQRSAVTVDDLITELEQARAAALSARTPQVSAAVAAIMGKAKLLGFDVAKMEVAGKNGAPLYDPADTALRIHELLERARQRRDGDNHAT